MSLGAEILDKSVNHMVAHAHPVTIPAASHTLARTHR
jgi:hypothetical protein